MREQPIYDVFLSHSSPDKAKYVVNIYERLKHYFQLNAFYDAVALPPGTKFNDRIISSIQSCCCMACFYSDSRQGDYFLIEQGMASMYEQIGDLDGFLLPVLLPGASNELSEMLKGRTWVDLRNGLDVSEQDAGTDRDPLDKLQRAIKAAVERNQAKLLQRQVGLTRPDINTSDLAQELPKLCDRDPQTTTFETAAQSVIDERCEAILFVTLRGPQCQEPQAFVDRVLHYILAQNQSLPLHKDKVQCTFASRVKSGQKLSDMLVKEMTLRLANACDMHGILGIESPKSLANVVKAVNRLNRITVVEYFVHQDAHPSTSIELIQEFYSRPEFALLQLPVVVCAIVTHEAKRSSVSDLISQLFGWRAKSSQGLSVLPSQKAALKMVDLPELEDVTEGDLAQWSQHPFVREFRPHISAEYATVVKSWQSQKQRTTAPMRDALQDLKQLLLTVRT